MPSTVFAAYSVLIVPGWQNSGPEHWQSQWQAQQPDWQRVMQRDWLTPQLADWVAALDAAIMAASRPVLLVAPGLASYCNAFLFNRIFDKYGMTLE